MCYIYPPGPVLALPLPSWNVWIAKYSKINLPENSDLTPEDFYDVKLYKKRNLIERFFGRLKENKRIACIP